MELKKVGKKYHLELDFDELDVVYHALGLYGDGLNNSKYYKCECDISD